MSVLGCLAGGGRSEPVGWCGGCGCGCGCSDVSILPEDKTNMKIGEGYVARFLFQAQTVDSDNPAVCHDKTEHQPCAACLGLPHDDESSY